MFWSGYKVHQPHFFHPHPSTSEQHSNHPNWRLLLMLHTCWNSWCNTLLSEETEVISSNFVSYSPRFFTILSQTFPFSLIIPTNGSKKVAVHAIRCLVFWSPVHVRPTMSQKCSHVYRAPGNRNDRPAWLHMVAYTARVSSKFVTWLLCPFQTLPWSNFSGKF